MTQTLDEIAARTQAVRMANARVAAIAAGFTSDEDLVTWSQAAEDAFHGVAWAMAKEQRGRRRRMRAIRREVTRSALVAAGVPEWVRWLVWLGKWSGYVLPAPLNVIVPAVLWVVEKMISQDDADDA